jgi:hypothetical protein
MLTRFAADRHSWEMVRRAAGTLRGHQVGARWRREPVAELSTGGEK